MASIKKQFLDLRQSTPKYVQWLLLAAAFIVVLILLTLLLSGDDKEKNAKISDAAPINLILSPAIDKIEWGDTVVGDKRKQTFEISATAPVKILGYRKTTEINGFQAQANCEQIGQIDTVASCELTLEYNPTAPAAAETFAFSIDWHAADTPAEMKYSHQITITVGAEKPFVEPEPIIIREPAPAPQPIVDDAIIDEYEEDDEEVFEDEIVRDIKKIAPPVKIEPDPQPAPVSAAACSDFAFPGYNNQGNQIGWIKPERGAYYFHPFSDKDCDSPTGVYNPDTGFITDIDNSGTKIGTDAEHIGYVAVGSGIQVPQLSDSPSQRRSGRAYQLTDDELASVATPVSGFTRVVDKTVNDNEKFVGSADFDERVVSSRPYDRTFILRQYKPIPATIVSEILADPQALAEGLPVRATVDRNVYSDNGRTVIIPTGTLLLGYVTGDIPGPYKAIGRMNIKWYQFVRPDGVEFNFPGGSDPFSADSQGRSGVPGRGSTDYMEQFIMPMLTAIVPAAVNLIAPISDKFVNQIDLDNNTVVQSGTVRSSELAKNEIITAWNQVAQKLLVDMMDNSVPPFSIAAGTRITVYSPVDLVVTCGPDATNKECNIEPYSQNKRRAWADLQYDPQNINYQDESWIGQARSFNATKWCEQVDGLWRVNRDMIDAFTAQGYSYGSVQMICESQNYKSINMARQDAIYQNQQNQFQTQYGDSSFNTDIGMTGIQGDQKYNQEILGLEYDESGAIVNPYESAKAEEEEAANVLKCTDGTLPDANGCCTGEIYTDLGGDLGFNCCPEGGGDCFPPIL